MKRFVIGSRIALVRFPRIPRSLRSQEYPQCFFAGAVHSLRRLQNMSKKNKKHFLLAKTCGQVGWLVMTMYCIFSTKGNNHPMTVQTFTFSPWSSDQASSGKCLYTSPVLSTADLLKRPNVKPLREVVADGSHRYVEEMVNHWLMISRDSCVSIYLYSYT